MQRIRRMLAGAVAVLLTFVMLAGTAAAHDPIFIADDQVSPDVGPYMPDGTISWALYGQVLSEGDTRGFEFDLREGDELFFSLLIPNLEPELGLADADLPVLMVEGPDGEVRTFEADRRDVFDEPFSRTSYVNLLEVREPAAAGGRYRMTVVGAAPSRFSVAVGESEIFFTDTERSGDRPSSFLEITEPLQVWYSTPPGGEPTGDASGVGIDLDLVEEAMESGEGEISEGGSLDGEPEPETEPEPAETEPEPAEPDPTAEPELEPTAEPEPEPSETDEVAAVAEVDGGDGDSGSTTWVAPVVVAAIAVLGAGWFFASRRGGSNASA